MVGSLTSLDDDLLTAVLVLLKEDDSRHTWNGTARHVAIVHARRVCRGWATLINSGGFLLQWDDAIRTLKARDRREVLSSLAKAGLLPASAAQTAAGLLRDLRLQRLPEWHEPPGNAMCDSISGAKGEVRQTFDLADGEMEERCNLVLISSVALFWWRPSRPRENWTMRLATDAGALACTFSPRILDSARSWR